MREMAACLTRTMLPADGPDAVVARRRRLARRVAQRAGPLQALLLGAGRDRLAHAAVPSIFPAHGRVGRGAGAGGGQR